MNNLIILRGLQGSGKTPFAKGWLAQDPEHRSCIARKEIRKTYFNDFFNSYWGDEVNEETVGYIEMGVASALMSEGLNFGNRDIIVDNLNVEKSVVYPYLQLAEEFEYKVEFIDFNVPLEELIKRDLAREKPTGEELLQFYWDTYIVDGMLPTVPSL